MTELSTASTPHRVAVIGGGLSGLAAAHHLLELAAENGHALQLQLFEASDRLGGAIWTDTIDAYAVVDGGADMFVTDKPWGLALAERLGLAPKLISPNSLHRRSLVLRDGAPVPVPEGFTLMAPTKVLPMLRTPLLSWRGKVRMAADVLLPRRDESASEDESVAAFVRRRFGQELLDRLVQPLIGGIYTGNPEHLSLRATMPRFLDMEREHRSVTLGAMKQGPAANPPGTSGARYGLFVSPKSGMASLIDRLAERVMRGGTVSLAQRVLAVEKRGAGFAVQFGANERRDFDAVILCLPAYAAGALLEPLALEVSRNLASIPYASTAVVATGHALKDVKHKLDAFGLVIPHVERRKIFAVSFSSRKLENRAPRGCVQLRTFVGGAMQPELFELSDARIEGLVLDELHALLGVDGTPDFIRIGRHPRAMPQYLVGHLDKVAAIERGLAVLPRLALAGNAYHGVGIPDCIHSGERAAASIMAELSKSQGPRARVDP